MSEFDFTEEFNRKVEELELDWDIYGMLDKRNNVYSLTHDAKIIGRLFELLAAPGIRGVADEHGLETIPAESQTIYPDFTLLEPTTYSNETDGIRKGDKVVTVDGNEISTREDIEGAIQNVPSGENIPAIIERDDNEVPIDIKPEEFNKIAVDVKTTYREFYQRAYKSYEAGDTRPFKFTLGSFASFLRNPTKNIQFDYRTYRNHYVIGFVYTRNTESQEGLVKDYEYRNEVPPPYENVEYFVNLKYKIAGTSPGSGNTENIGSFTTNDVEDLREGNGPFADQGKEVFKEYWRNYGRYREADTFTDLDEFFEWREDHLNSAASKRSNPSSSQAEDNNENLDKFY